MKYIVFSFDDGLYDFYKNVFPLFEENNLKASINVVSGYSDKSIESGNYNCMSFNVLLELYKRGFELAVHSNSHMNSFDFDDFVICKEKLSKLTGEKRFGVIIPFSKQIPEKYVNRFEKEDFLYLADYNNHNKNKPLHIKLMTFMNKIIKDKKIGYYVGNYRYIKNIKSFSKTNFCVFDRLPIRNDVTLDKLFFFLKKIRHNQFVSLMFHSIVSELDENVPWKEGAWLLRDLKELIIFLKKNNFTIVTQKELFEIINE